MLRRATTLGPLTCQIVQRGEAPPVFAVVLCHGFGASGTDLVGLGAELLSRNPGWPDGVRFVFPAGPISLEEFGYGEARGWWMIDFGALMGVHQGDEGMARRLREEVPEGLPPARKQLLSLLEALRQQTSLPMSKILLGGFSQGSMLTTDVALRLEEAPAGLAVFSGALICEAEWKRRAPVRKGLRVLQSHGRQDPTLPFFGAEALRDTLTDAGLAVEFLTFNGGHEITSESLDRLGALISAQLQPVVRSGTP